MQIVGYMICGAMLLIGIVGIVIVIADLIYTYTKRKG